VAHARLANILQHMRTIASLQAYRGQTVAALLAAFTSGQHEAAFAALVQRHGRMVLGVFFCKVLTNVAYYFIGEAAQFHNPHVLLVAGQ
jgi:hypothetical protein